MDRCKWGSDLVFHPKRFYSLLCGCYFDILGYIYWQFDKRFFAFSFSSDCFIRSYMRDVVTLEIPYWSLLTYQKFFNCVDMNVVYSKKTIECKILPWYAFFVTILFGIKTFRCQIFYPHFGPHAVSTHFKIFWCWWILPKSLMGVINNAMTNEE